MKKDERKKREKKEKKKTSLEYFPFVLPPAARLVKVFLIKEFFRGSGAVVKSLGARFYRISRENRCLGHGN